jgi:hypothetical protein
VVVVGCGHAAVSDTATGSAVLLGLIWWAKGDMTPSDVCLCAYLPVRVCAGLANLACSAWVSPLAALRSWCQRRSMR